MANFPSALRLGSTESRLSDLLRDRRFSSTRESGRYTVLPETEEEAENGFDGSEQPDSYPGPKIELQDFYSPFGSGEPSESVQNLGVRSGSVITTAAKNVARHGRLRKRSWEGTEFMESSGTVNDDLGGLKGDQTSYFFPEDPNPPTWRPVSMQSPCIIVLAITALILGGLQEYSYQYSRALVDEKPRGLLTFESPADISSVAYFAWKYLPTMILVTYAVMWQVVDCDVKRLEPYHQLSRKDGALSTQSLSLSYLTTLGIFIPGRALYNQHWPVFFSSLASIISTYVTVILQSASITTDLGHVTRTESKRVLVVSAFSRLLTVSLWIVAALGIMLLVSLRRKSGLLGDPKGIAGVAAMATRSHILRDFADLDSASNNAIDARLSRRRYHLHKGLLWQGAYLRVGHSADKSEDSRLIMLRLSTGIIFVSYIVLVMIFLPVFVLYVQERADTNKIPCLLTILATGIKAGWSAVDIQLRVMEPYFILSRGKAPPATLTLEYTAMVPGWLTVKAVINKHWFVALVSFGAMLSNLLVVCMASLTADSRMFVSGQSGNGSDVSELQKVPLSARTFKSLWISLALSIGILFYLTLIAVPMYFRRRGTVLPRQPGSIASLLAYIHQSRMLFALVGAEDMNSWEITRIFEAIGKNYGFGWFTGRDGEDHCGIDEEPLRASYKFGHDWSRINLDASQIGTWEHF